MSKAYYGDQVAKLAKQKGTYVAGLSMEPEKLTEPHYTVGKGEVDLVDYIGRLKGGKK